MLIKFQMQLDLEISFVWKKGAVVQNPNNTYPVGNDSRVDYSVTQLIL
jgi:hypothetical protein